MRLLFTALACFIGVSIFAQEETRLALVIGNENYTAGELNNPVNDALLVAQTLDSLGFDVILDTNIESKSEFIKSIREFGNKRGHYDVAFVYYAGHGIQIGSENFLLPTKEMYNSEFDVEDFGVSVQNILRYLNGVTDKVNILVLDACRNNPFEHNWNTTRSLEGGKGLAKIPPPTGSLIAFSTAAGLTAADGNGSNSIYCRSLCDNMLKENISLDQVFRNVRSDVLRLTNGMQRPVESSQLTGSVFYLNTVSIQTIATDINNLILENELDLALELSNFLIYKFPQISIGYTKRGHIFYLQSQYEKAEKNYQLAIEINPLDREAYKCVIYSDEYYEILGISSLYENIMRDFKQAEKLLNNLLSIDQKNPEILLSLSKIEGFGEKKNHRKAISHLNFIIDSLDHSTFDKFKPFHYLLGKNQTSSILGSVYMQMSYNYDELGQIDSSLYYCNLALEIEKDDLRAYILKQQGDLYLDKGEFQQAISSYNSAIKIYNLEPRFLDSRADCFIMMDNFNQAEKDLSTAIEIAHKTGSLMAESYHYYYRSKFYLNQKKHYLKALLDINNAIYKFEENEVHLESWIYLFRGEIFNKLDDIDLMCEDYARACELGDCEAYNKHCH